jgi:hypothetical protein
MIMKKIMHSFNAKNPSSSSKLTVVPTCESRDVFSIITTYNSAKKVNISEKIVILTKSSFLMLL